MFLTLFAFALAAVALVRGGVLASRVRQLRKERDALITTVAGLLVAIPSMFGYNWLVHNLRVLTVELDNFAQELVSKMETEYLEDD